MRWDAKLRGDEQEPHMRCGTPGTSGHVTAKFSICGWGVTQSSEPPYTCSVCAVVWEEGHREMSPIPTGPNETLKRGDMKPAGILLLVIGSLFLLFGFGMDTTVPTDVGQRRVHNIGLMNERQNTMLLGAALAIVGALFVGFSRRSALVALPELGTRKCPYCAEAIKREATVCRFCNRDLVPAENTAASEAANSSAGSSSLNDDLQYWPYTWKRRPKQ